MSTWSSRCVLVLATLLSTNCDSGSSSQTEPGVGGSSATAGSQETGGAGGSSGAGGGMESGGSGGHDGSVNGDDASLAAGGDGGPADGTSEAAMADEVGTDTSSGQDARSDAGDAAPSAALLPSNLPSDVCKAQAALDLRITCSVDLF